MTDDGSRAMGSSTPEREGGVSLREFLIAQIHSLDVRVQLRADLAEKALNAAAQSMERRLDSMNEFRDQLKDQGNTFSTRMELEKLEGTSDTRLKSLETSRANLDGRMAMIGIFILAINILLGHYWK
jgi:hypothetical protein